MKKIINAADQVVEQMVEGLAKSHPDLVERVPDTRVLARVDKRPGKVGLVSGGGSGHEPAHAGYVGNGMLSAAVCGDVFTSPTPDQIHAGIKAADQGKGVLLIVKNYTGDVMNFDMAKELAEMDDIQVEQIIVNDDIAVEDSTFTTGRRGVAGTVLVHKIVGAAAEAGASLEELKALGEKVTASIKTIGVALSPCTVPEVGHPGFELGPDEIELGIGIHGEPGFSREKIMPSQDLAKQLLERIDNEHHFAAGDKLVVLVNGMGATPLMEQYVFANDVHEWLGAKGTSVEKTLVGDYMTSLEMAGVSLTVLKLADEKWLDMLNYPVRTIAWN
ncbi:dihydroxyacetone kinase subunit DhaK [Listeria floridensis FSL S10-1187]|uniref:Dihydroxyacetone kinase subunit DhaK n=1 Tax=Listeria floridensis FSL S10-1187 TaxID=1265817 RepID=A0ABP3AWF4_9LIST|nr:dihydroxyacetone kinase subunit DhaK [Listeria floridensis]EUJ27196.1 dihydroxyacetone kinase subunit DhaK [Listeria floridensis FSL S10-1187]